MNGRNLMKKLNKIIGQDNDPLSKMVTNILTVNCNRTDVGVTTSKKLTGTKDILQRDQLSPLLFSIANAVQQGTALTK
jgi:hypothetical protein